MSDTEYTWADENSTFPIVWEEANETGAENTIEEGWVFRRVYGVQTNDKTLDAADVTTMAENHGLPRIGTSYSGSYPHKIAKRQVPRRNSDNPKLWTIEIRYSNRDVAGFEDDDPTNSPAQMTTSYATNTKAFEWAWEPDGSGGYSQTKQVTNSNGQIMPNAPTRTEHLTVLEITVFEDDFSFDPGNYESYMGTINLNQITLMSWPIKIGHGLMRVVRPQPKISKAGKVYWEVHFEVLIDPGQHFVEVQDKGWSAKHPDTGEPKKLNREKQPWAMDGSGNFKKPVPPDLPDNYTPPKPATLQFQPHKPMDWSGLPIPDTYGD